MINLIDFNHTFLFEKIASDIVGAVHIKRGRTVTGLQFTVEPKANIKKALEEKNDPYTADIFTIDGLNDKQLGRIVRNPSFIADYNHLVTPNSLAGRSKQE